MIGIKQSFKIILSNYWSFSKKCCVFIIQNNNIVLEIFDDSRKHMSTSVIKSLSEKPCDFSSPSYCVSCWIIICDCDKWFLSEHW